MNAAQDDFDLIIGRLDRVLSKLVGWGKKAKRRNKLLAEGKIGDLDGEMKFVDEANQQTLKHHAEDMIAAGRKMLTDLGREVEGNV